MGTRQRLSDRTWFHAHKWARRIHPRKHLLPPCHEGQERNRRKVSGACGNSLQSCAAPGGSGLLCAMPVQGGLLAQLVPHPIKAKKGRRLMHRRPVCFANDYSRIPHGFSGGNPLASAHASANARSMSQACSTRSLWARFMMADKSYPIPKTSFPAQGPVLILS